MIKHIVLKFINFIVPKKKNSYYFEPLKNCYTDCYDVLNYTGDTLLSFLHYFMEHQSEKCSVYIVCYHSYRFDLYKSLEAKYLNISFKFLLDDKYVFKKKLFLKIKKLFYFFRSKFLFFEPVLVTKPYMINRQIKISLGYFSTFKSDFNQSDNKRNFKKWNLICSTSKLDSIMKSAAYNVPFQCFKNFGLCRNDYLLLNNSKSDVIKKWLLELGFKDDTTIILYAPTYRDYESNGFQHIRSIWGFDVDDKMEEFLCEKNAVVIAKMHSWQNKIGIKNKGRRTILFEPTFDFTFYDLMKESKLLISDYSSIVLDYQLLDKPVIFNLYDIDLYLEKRGFAFEPYEYCCAGRIVTKEDDLIPSIEQELLFDSFKEKRDMINKVVFNPLDNSSCERVFNYLKKSDKK